MEAMELLDKIQEAIMIEADKKIKMVDGTGFDNSYLTSLERHNLMQQALGLNEALSIVDEFKLVVLQNKKGE